MLSQDFVAFVVVDCSAESAALGDSSGCASVLNRPPVVLTLFLSNGKHMPVPNMESLSGLISNEVPHRIKQLLNEGVTQLT